MTTNGCKLNSLTHSKALVEISLGPTAVLQLPLETVLQTTPEEPYTFTVRLRLVLLAITHQSTVV